MKHKHEDLENCQKKRPEQVYTHLQEIIDNLSYFFMTVLGALVFVTGLESGTTRWLLAVVYVLYGIAGALWIIIFVCPYCHYYGTRACPCGYGQVSAKLCAIRDQSRFIEKFKKHIPVIIPLWIIPVVTGIILLLKNFSWIMLVLVLLFAIDAFLVLPLVSKKYGCAHCPQKSTCPWMRF
jgi:tryptophan-rich sensory protein